MHFGVQPPRGEDRESRANRKFDRAILGMGIAAVVVTIWSLREGILSDVKGFLTHLTNIGLLEGLFGGTDTTTGAEVINTSSNVVDIQQTVHDTTVWKPEHTGEAVETSE